MRGNEQLARVRERYGQLLSEVREVAARVRARVDEVRRRFPDDESLTERDEVGGSSFGEPAIPTATTGRATPPSPTH